MNALSLAPNVNNWLTHTHEPRILHIFDSACNLINERREVLSSVTPEIGDGPFNLVIEEKVCFTEHLSFQSVVSISSNKIMLGNLTIQFTDAKLWNPCPVWERLYDHRDKIANQLMKLPVTRDQPLLPQSLVSNLSLSLANGDLSSARKVTSQLAGLGAGLTPAGDDFIMGAIYAVWIVHPREIANVLTQAIADTAAPLTTSLSAAWLRSAGKGEAGILWHKFFDALISVDTMRIQQTMNKILAVGETSGADALAGFMSTLSYSIPHSSI